MHGTFLRWNVSCQNKRLVGLFSASMRPPTRVIAARLFPWGSITCRIITASLSCCCFLQLFFLLGPCRLLLCSFRFFLRYFSTLIKIKSAFRYYKKKHSSLSPELCFFFCRNCLDDANLNAGLTLDGMALEQHRCF